MIFKNKDNELKNHGKISENDSFWDVEFIVPPKKYVKKEKNPVFDTSTVSVGTNKVFDSHTEKIPVQSTEKNENELLFEQKKINHFFKSVKVYSWGTKYNFYEKFRNDAEKYYELKVDFAEYSKFFSYLPVYAQMSEQQKNWYFFWRTKLRSGEYLETDSSYVMLYIYELLNLSDKRTPEETLGLLIDVWLYYRESYTKLDRYMSEWITDFCLINKLSPPIVKLKPIFRQIIKTADIKEFFLDPNGKDPYTSFLIECKSPYNFRDSNYIDEQTADYFEKHIYGAVGHALKILSKSDGRFDPTRENSVISRKALRDSFSGALCSYGVKRKIEIDYFSYSFPNDLLPYLGDLIKYAENRVRASLGIRARYSVRLLSDFEKNTINEYFSENSIFDKSKKSTTDCFTEREEHTFSVEFDKAKEIERESWKTTDRLIDDIVFEEEEKTEENKTEESETLDFAKEALFCIAKDDIKGFERIAENNYLMKETLVECVNELCYEIVGDIAVEYNGKQPSLISDYEQEIKEWLRI